MRKEYDFSESIKNPYLNKAKEQVTIHLDKDTIAYFKALAAEKGIPHQSLINLYLRECVESAKKSETRVDNIGQSLNIWSAHERDS